MKAEKKSEAEADAVMLTPPEHYPTHDKAWLNGADIYESLTETVVVNPRNLNPTTLYDVDFEWLHSRALFHKWRNFYRDMDKRPQDMR